MLSYVQSYILLSKLCLDKTFLINYFNNNSVYSVDNIYNAINRNTIFEVYSKKLILNVLNYVDDYIYKIKNLGISIIKNTFDFGLLYTKGNISLLKNNIYRVCVVGSRDISNINESDVDYNIRNLVINNYCVVSGLAMGGDTIVHRLTIKNNGNTIAVLPSSIDNIYPKRNNNLANDILNNNGLLISQFGLYSQIYKYNFVIRDNLMLLISNRLFILGENMSRGVNHTIRFAKKYNKEVVFI